MYQIDTQIQRGANQMWTKYGSKNHIKHIRKNGQQFLGKIPDGTRVRIDGKKSVWMQGFTVHGNTEKTLVQSPSRGGGEQQDWLDTERLWFEI